MWSRRVSTERQAASTIKMLSALVVREHTNLNEIVVIPRKAAAISDGDVGLAAGQRVTVRQLLRLMLVASANDAAEALAIHVSGSEGAFVAEMNAKANELGLSHTHAIDPHGLSERETSSAGDLAALARHVMADPGLRPMLTMRSVVVPLPGGKSKTVEATNELLEHYSGLEGVKTGYTSEAGYCFVGAAKRGEVELVGVVMGARSNAARFSEMRKLLDWGFAHSRMRVVVATGTPLASVPVTGGAESSVTVHAIRSFKAVEFDGSPFTTAVATMSDVHAPVRRGQKLGVVEVFRAGVLVERRGLYADRAVPALPEMAPVPDMPKLGKSIQVSALWESVRVLLDGLRS